MPRTSERKGGRKLFSGAFFATMGAIGFIWAQQYHIGTANQMGPGYFPAFLGVLLIGVGLAQVAVGLIAERAAWPITWPDLWPVLLILLSVISFGAIIERGGLVPAIFAAVLFACLGRVRTHPIEVLLTFVVLAAFCSVVFVYLFGMPMHLYVLPE
jgi:hypothetical protein